MKEQAKRILDAVKDGKDIPLWLIDKALRESGDLK
jgi:hypothetical protein